MRYHNMKEHHEKRRGKMSPVKAESRFFRTLSGGGAAQPRRIDPRKRYGRMSLKRLNEVLHPRGKQTPWMKDVLACLTRPPG